MPTYLDLRINAKEFRAELEKTENKYGFISANVYRHELHEWFPVCRYIPNLLTNGGRDFIHNQVYTNTSAGTRGAGFMAVTSDTGAPAAGDTTLASEITTNGLARADVTTKTHTNGTNSTVLDHIYTASGSFTAVQKVGIFNASSAGTMVNEGTISATDLVSGDKLEVIYTLNNG